MVSRADKFFDWGISAEQIWSFRTRIDNLNWTVPDGLAGAGMAGRHGGLGSTTFHNELGALIDASRNMSELQAGLVNLANRWSIPNLPRVIPQ